MSDLAMSYRLAHEMDIPLLAGMNLQLIQDEGSANSMNLEQLSERMAGFLKSEWQAVILLSEEETIGYALYQERQQPFQPERVEIYIRQYFIVRNYRQKGMGRRGMSLLKEELFPKRSSLTIDVLHHNEVGHAFWSSLGFRPYSIQMKIEAD
ncbi:GNAT family N-acetyltransferase [Paenibacillus pinisoli]|uniref:GNAT family N-acetyltransferase n=1 Tax=Paenibacillus pinisoli TaxID=1276110 RepID=A0A3A6PB65_9BACL|nr:GNAT family N-acetyltransferase [Paenibacillus pinisoli]RJX37637.1 GNAT family N-acetyltransferase [Paenibacillus pinisoli]